MNSSVLVNLRDPKNTGAFLTYSSNPFQKVRITLHLALQLVTIQKLDFLQKA